MHTMVLCYILAQQIPFNPTDVGGYGMQLVWIGAFYLIYGIPFFLGALFIGITFIALSSQMHKLYFWNMVGSGLGGLLIVICMYLLSTEKLMLPILFVLFFAALLSALRTHEQGNKVFVKKSQLVSTLGGLALCLFFLLFLGRIRVPDYKPIFTAYNIEDAKVTTQVNSPVGEIQVFKSTYFHSAPGMSMNAAQAIERVQRQPFCGLYIDGNGPIVIMGKALENERIFLDFLPMSAPYFVKENPEVLLVNLGGSINMEVAKYHHASGITVVEPNSELVRLYREDPFLRDFTGARLADPALKVVVGEPRAYCAGHRSQFDIIEISLVDSVGLSQSGGYPVQEIFTYTREAIRDYIFALKQDGILSITVWDKLKPPRNVVKILSTVVESLKSLKMENPSEHLFVANYLNSTATILVKKSPFTPEEIKRLLAFNNRLSLNTIYYPCLPGIPCLPEIKLDMSSLINYYYSWFGNDPERKKNKPAYVEPALFYRTALIKMLDGEQEELYRDYFFDVAPMTDDRPYYSVYLKPETLGMFLPQLRSVSEEWGYLLLLAVLILSVIFALLIILIPLAGRWRELFSKRRGTGGIIIYYACLGLGYMLIEMFLIQRLVFFLSDPTISTSLVITVMLIISGIGSIWSTNLSTDRKRIVRLAVLGIGLSIVFYLFGLAPLLSLFLGVPFLLKLVIVILIIAPAALFMGIPFPNGLASLSDNRPGILPWAWGMNGALSVTGSVLGRLVSVSFGFSAVLVAALFSYGLVGLLYPVNEGRRLFNKE
jgi:spermidine synthase